MSRPGPAPPGRWSRRSSAGCVPVITALAAEGAAVSVDTMRAEVAEAALDAGAVVVNDVVRRPRRPADPRRSWPTPVRRTSRCTGARTADRMQQHRVVRRAGGVVDGGARRAGAAGRGGRRGRDPGRADRPRPGARLRQDRRAQLGAAAPASTRSTGARLPGAGGLEPQVVPRYAARRPRRRAAAGRRPRGRQRRADRARWRRQGSGASGCTTYAPAATRCAWSRSWPRSVMSDLSL